jgi:hypothetical protein
MKVRSTKIAKSDHDSSELFFAALEPWVPSAPKTLDMFARDGAITVSKYCEWAGELHLWELGPEHKKSLDKFGATDVKIGCSYEHLRNCTEQFDMVVIDTPQGLHKDYNGVVHAEHFDILKEVGPILREGCWVVLYVNRKPYNKDETGSHGYDEYDEYDFNKWMTRRANFYGAYALDVSEEAALRAYRRVLGPQGWSIAQMVLTPCLSDIRNRDNYAYRLGLNVRRTT